MEIRSHRKTYMIRVEGENTRLRHYLARLKRKSLCYSKLNSKLLRYSIQLLIHASKICRCSSSVSKSKKSFSLVCDHTISLSYLDSATPQIFMSTIPCEDQLAQLVQFRLDLYALFSNSRDSLMDLLDALSGNTTAHSPVELCEHPSFRRGYSALYKAIVQLNQPSSAPKTVADRKQLQPGGTHLIKHCSPVVSIF